ncbi:MAG: AI-2E family transporter [Candidatus Cyclobacteriaceae bacterium M3_2C_046]
MNKKVRQIILFSTLIVVGFYFLFLGLAKAKGFLIPFTIATLLAMLMLPVSQKFEQWGLARGWSVLLSDLIILAFVIGVFFLVGSEIDRIAEDWPQLKQKVKPKIEKFQQYVSENFGISESEQERKIQENLPGNQNSSSPSSNTEKSQNFNNQSSLGIGSALMKVFKFMGNMLLVFVYIFFFMLYRSKFKKAILKMVPDQHKEQADKVIRQTSQVSQQYLLGRFILIVFLAALYSIGLSIVGIKHAIFVSMIAALLSLIPYIGNVIGGGLAIAMAFFTSGGIGAVIGVVIVFSIVQFIESYMLEPFVVGHKVDLNPVLTIVGVVLGGAVWGTAGMIMAIPILGILKVIFDNVNVLQPVGYALGEEDISGGDNWFKRFENWFRKKVKP